MVGKKRHNAKLRGEPDTMTAEQLVATRNRLKMTQVEMAAELSVPKRTYENYEQDRRVIPHSIKRTIKLMLQVRRLQDNQ